MLSSKLKKQLGILGVGLSANWAMVCAFDFILYPFVIYMYGVLLGGFVMMILSFLVCYATLLFYDWAKKDWIGIETLKGLKEYSSGGAVRQFISRIVRKGDSLAMIVLSIQFDPFITVAYMRHGANQYGGLSKRDWKIFIGSLIIGNVYWTLAAFMGITIVEVLWKIVVGAMM